MKANELRIGNIIEWNKQQFNVCRIFDNGIENENWCKPLNELHGMPLTKDWLIKFGFKTDEYKQEFELNTINLDCEYTDKGEWIVFLKGHYIKPIESNNLYNCHYYPRADIKYVHQLQNLYYTITAEELTTKP